MKLLALAAILVAGYAVAAGNSYKLEPIVSLSALQRVEKATNDRFAPGAGDSYELLGDARGTYLPGYGGLFSFEMNLVNVEPITPFHMTVTPQEIKSIHERKIKQLAVLKNAMRELMIQSAGSLSTLPPTEQITFEAFLIHLSFEDRSGLPRRLTMTTSRQKLLDAAANHATPAALASLIEEREE